MSTPAIIMMVLFLLVIWGGMALSIVHYVKNPDDIDSVTGSGTDPAGRTAS